MGIAIASPSRFWSVAIGVAITTLLCASSTAQASCGNYLQHHGFHVSPPDATDAPLEVPCHGPGCRGQSPTQPVVPSTPTSPTRTMDELASTVFSVLAPEPVSCDLPGNTEVSTLSGHRLGVDRPPETA
jgi:hypothetical protein